MAAQRERHRVLLDRRRRAVAEAVGAEQVGRRKGRQLVLEVGKVGERRDAVARAVAARRGSRRTAKSRSHRGWPARRRQARAEEQRRVARRRLRGRRRRQSRRRSPPSRRTARRRRPRPRASPPSSAAAPAARGPCAPLLSDGEGCVLWRAAADAPLPASGRPRAPPPAFAAATGAAAAATIAAAARRGRDRMARRECDERQQGARRVPSNVKARSSCDPHPVQSTCARCEEVDAMSATPLRRRARPKFSARSRDPTRLDFGHRLESLEARGEHSRRPRSPSQAAASGWSLPRAAADHVAVVMHDATLDRTTDGSGLVMHTTYAELCKLDAACHTSPSGLSFHDLGFRGVASLRLNAC